MQFPTCLHFSLLNSARVIDEVNFVVEIHRSTYVVGNNLCGVSDSERVVPSYPEHSVFLIQPLQNGAWMINDVTESL
jgi:hypothetical protein